MRRAGVWLVLSLLIVVGISRLKFDADPLNLLPGDVPSVAGLRLHQTLFSGGRELLVTIRADSPDSAARLAEAIAEDLRAETNLVAAARWQFPLRENAAENVAWMWLQQPPDSVRQLAARLAPDRLRTSLVETRERLSTTFDPGELARGSYDPLGLLAFPEAAGGEVAEQDAMFSNASGTFRVVFVEPRNSRMQYQEATRWLVAVKERVDAVRARLASHSVGDAVHIAFTGGPAFLSEIANGMQGDITSSVVSTLIVIGVLFWLAHRSYRPLVLLVVSLAVALLITLSIGGLVFGTLNVIGCGFAAVMMGLVVDYGLMGYQELRAHPGLSIRQLRRVVLPGIGWSAATTAGTFLSLGLAGLPGLAELGAMTAIGLGVGAVVMLFGFLPGVVRLGTSALRPDNAAQKPLPVAIAKNGTKITWLWTATAVAVCAGLIAICGWPRVEGGAEPLRPRNSPAYAAMDELQRELGRTNRVTWLLFRGPEAESVSRRMREAAPVLADVKAGGAIRSYHLPTGFWPEPDRAKANVRTVSQMATNSAAIPAVLEEAGFSTESFALASGVFDFWKRWAGDEAAPPLWPTNDGARWISGMVSGRAEDGSWVGLGTVESSGAWVVPQGLGPDVLVTGWELLGPDLLERVRHRVAWMTAGIAGVLAVCLWLAFRRWSEVLLGLAGLALSFGLLLAVMSVAGASWNLLNLVAVPLVLGTSVDSVIHVQLAMRRYRGDLRAVWRTTGIALLLCAGANIAGFGSLAWSSNAGLASLDLVCAGGVICVLIVALVLLPRWWLALHGNDPEAPASEEHQQAGPSQLYGPALWRLGCAVVRWFPRACLAGGARFVAGIYRRVRPDRMETVVGNLLPLIGEDSARARQIAAGNFGAFAEKLVDLWRYEAGVKAAADVEFAGDLERFIQTMSCENGVVLVTPHIGNWELGGAMLVKFGIKPLVLSAPEPDGGLTEMRARARALHGVETLVVGSDPFAFVEVIKRLQSGGVVALLIDRPGSASAADVEFLGRPFKASVAAAELARATGCRIVPVYIVRESGRYRAHMLPPLEYARAALGSRENRREFAGRILRVFEPVIRQFPEQWFHFVPVWKNDGRHPDSNR